MFEITIPSNYIIERQYAVNTFFDCFLGLPFRIKINDDLDYGIYYNDELILTIEDHFFSYLSEESYISKDLIPIPKSFRALPYFDKEDGLISLFHTSDSDQIIYYSNEVVQCKSDLFAAIFFMLSRWEEACIEDLDEHSRVSAKQSVAYKYGFLNRPIVNEYAEFILNILKSRIPNLEWSNKDFSFIATHDVDVPFEYYHCSLTSLFKQLVGDILKRNSINSFVKRLKDYYFSKYVDISFDPFNNFNEIIALSHQYNVISYFNFFGENTGKYYDCRYSLGEKEIQKIIQEIYHSGHQIGFHPSYNSYNNESLIRRQFKKLSITCKKLGIEQEFWGGRQHYLRWDVMRTPNYWDSSGINFDSTLGYYDMPGFRCGTCYPFPLFDLMNRRILKIVEVPLLAMECSFFDYAKMSFDEAVILAKDLFEKTMYYGGNFVILWHNDKLIEKESRYYKLYLELLKFNKQVCR